MKYLFFNVIVVAFFLVGKKAFPFETPVDTLGYESVKVVRNVNLNARFAELEKNFEIKSRAYNFENFEDQFSFEHIKKEFPETFKDKNNRQEAKVNLDEIARDNKWVDSFSNEDIQTLPVGIQKEISGVTYQIGIAKALFTKDFTELTVFARIILPQTDERGEPIELFFGANNVKLSHGGGLIGETNLVLLGDVFIPFNKGNWLFSLKGGFDMTTGVTQNTTYVTIDCDGVKELALQGEVQFSRKMLLPVDENTGKPLSEKRPYKRSDDTVVQIPNRVRGSFNIVATDWNDLVVDISLSPFVLAKHPDKFMFAINEAKFDFSDLRTPDVNFPDFYREKSLLQPSVEAWRGVFVRSLKIGLPEAFKTEESISQNKRVSFEAVNMIIDSYGVSGYFSVENIIPLKSGRTSNSKAWAYSVDQFGVELAANTIVSANFSGQLQLPVNNKNNAKEGEKIGLGYTGIISEEEYKLNVTTLDQVNFDVFQAKATLEPNSIVELEVIDGNFRPKAILTGSLDISAKDKPDSNEKSLTDFKGVVFQNMVLQTKSPIFQTDYLGYKSKGTFGNFPVSIPEIAMVANDYEASLIFGLQVNLMSKGFSGSTRLRIQGAIEDENRRQRWKFKAVKLETIALEATIGNIELSGALDLLRNDPVYGNGFSAEIQGKFGNVGPISTKAIFGKKDFRYWYLDASVQGLNIPVVPPLVISGFSGGAAYRMTRNPNASAAKFSPSGLSYVPNKNSALTVKAMITASTGASGTLDVGAGFEIEFNNNYGVNRLGFFGEAKVMAALDFPNPAAAMQDQLKGMVNNEAIKGALDTKAGKTFLDKSTEEYPKSASATATIEGRIGINFDFANKAFHADMELFVNTPGGFVQGVGPNGLAGWGVVHVDPEEWYAYLGTPSKRVGLRIGVGPISVETTGYFMVGDRLEGSPPPPPEVAEILGVELSELDYMRNENDLSSGKGFAFGTNFKVDTGDMQFLVFYARFMAGAGFDIMLRDYGEASCKNTGKQIGIDGWYANGQAYVYLQGELGIRVKLFFIKKKIPIIEAGAAVLLQAKAPNPIWIKGYLGGHYNLLGGLVKGRFRFKVELGEVCELANASPLGGIKIITDLTPKDNTTDIDVFAAPQAAFNMKVNEEIIIPEDEGDKVYKILLDKFEVTDASGNVIEGEIEWGQGNDRATFYSTDILPPNTKLKVVAEVSFLEKVNGAFQVITEDGKKAVEREERNFTTGTAPTYIPLHNIEYCYPVVDQQFFYPKEYSKGYIKLKRGQDYLFDDTQWKSEVLILDPNENKQIAQMSYGTAENKVSYSLPNISNETKFGLAIISSPKNKTNRSSESKRKTKRQELDEEATFEVANNEAQNVSKDGVIERLNYEFSTSKYNTFVSKMNAIRVSQHMDGKVNSNTIFLLSKINEFEGFDLVELEGSSFSNHKPLIFREALLNDRYFKEDIFPIIYNQYPIHNKYSFTRNIEEFGRIPKKSIPIIGSYLDGLRHNTDISLRRTKFPYMYDVPKIYEKDIYDIKVQINNDWASGLIDNNNPVLTFLNNSYKFMRKGSYSIQLDYVLPGELSKSSKNYNFKNTLEIR